MLLIKDETKKIKLKSEKLKSVRLLYISVLNTAKTALLQP